MSDTIWYVKGSGDGDGDGRSWETAFRTLGEALVRAAAGHEIWVAAGTYVPHESDRTVSFQLVEDVAVYGGFAGTETRRDERDPARHVTTLSGDIGQGDRTRNTVTIVKGANGALLDGFTIRDAYATDRPRMHLVPDDILANDMDVGGGMRNFMVAPTVRRCIFTANHSAKGGAVYNVQEPAGPHPLFEDVTFVENSATARGGAVSNDLGVMPRFVGCRFLRNRCADKGGALYNDFAASPVLVNCLFEGNQAVSAAAVGNDGGSCPLLVHVTIRGNTAESGWGSGLYQGTGADNNPVVVASVIDDIYSWHEDVVAALHADVPQGETVGLPSFLRMSNAAGVLEEADLTLPPDTGKGFDAAVDSAAVSAWPLVRKLTAFLPSVNGTMSYPGEYTRPAPSTAGAVGPVVYVAAEADGDGSSWTRAMGDLQQAIDQADGASIWVKSGMYRPSTVEPGRIAAFILRDGVTVYGGFAGHEESVDERTVDGPPTVLSARTADGSDGYGHVLYGADDVTLDRLTVRDGRASGTTYHGKGGGLLAYRAGKTFLPHDPAIGFRMTLRGCRFVDNQAVEGGAIYLFGKARLTIEDTLFERNEARFGGAVMDREGNETTYTGCTSRANRAMVDGGAVYLDYGTHARFSTVTFSGNEATKGGAVYCISRASQLEATVVDVEEGVFEQNAASEGADVFNQDTSEVRLARCIVGEGTVSGRVTWT